MTSDTDPADTPPPPPFRFIADFSRRPSNSSQTSAFSFGSDLSQPTTAPAHKERWRTGVNTWSINVAPAVDGSSSSSDSPPSNGCRALVCATTAEVSCATDLQQPRPIVAPVRPEPVSVARATPFLPGISGGIWSTGLSSSPHMSYSPTSLPPRGDDVSSFLEVTS